MGRPSERFDDSFRRMNAVRTVLPRTSPADALRRPERCGEPGPQLSQVFLELSSGPLDLGHLLICCRAHRASSFTVSRILLAGCRSRPQGAAPDQHEDAGNDQEQRGHDQDRSPHRQHHREPSRGRRGGEADRVHPHDAGGGEHPRTLAADGRGLGRLDLGELQVFAGERAEPIHGRRHHGAERPWPPPSAGAEIASGAGLPPFSLRVLMSQTLPPRPARRTMRLFSLRSRHASPSLQCNGSLCQPRYRCCRCERRRSSTEAR